MAIDDGFDASTNAVLLDMAQRPRPPVKQEPALSVWGLAKAGPRGALAGIAQGIGSGVDILDAAAQVSGSLGTEDWLMPDPVKAAAATEQARQRLKEQGGPSYQSDVGRSFRNVGRDYMPDPVTSHSAEQAVANLFRLGTKAVASAATLGPVGGAVVAGAEEGFSTADDLAQQGVDLATRTQVGAVTAAFTAGSFALPVAGQTWKATAGLAVAGGPASFIGQNAATREILANADYASLANQYDPFDPVGLTLSTLLPLGFGALAMRGAKGVKAPGEVPTNDVRTGPRPDPESVDAARVNLLRENVDSSRPVPANDIAGAVKHETAVARAIDQLAAGERVEVSDVAPITGVSRIVEDMAPRVGRMLDEVAPTLREMEPPAAAIEPLTPAKMAESVAQGEAAVLSRAEPEAQTVKLVSESPEVDRAANLIEAEMPDLMVHLDDMDAPVTVAELMKTVREQLTRDLQESPLIEAAAACFVSSGG